MMRVGMLTPSSNTALEPLTQAILAPLPDVTVHFSRFRVTEIALTDRALGQFDDAPILRAAELLAHAKVDVIAWNGTSAGWLGFSKDEQLCARITAVTGVAATTSMLALNEVLAARGVRRLGLVTPYTDDVQARIVANYAGLGVACADERHFRLRDNFSFAEVTPEQIAAAVAEVAVSRPDAIAIVCTNLRAAHLAADLERTHGIPILDSIALTVWKTLLVAGADPARVEGWGSLFTQAGSRSGG
jgi:maleate isomerase